MAGNKPHSKLRMGGITLTEWKNQSKDGEKEWFTYNLQRSYKDGDEWKNTDSFRVQDLATVSALVSKKLQDNVKTVEES